jgi:hypothetical protein
MWCPLPGRRKAGAPVSSPRSLLNNRASVDALVRQFIVQLCHPYYSDVSKLHNRRVRDTKAPAISTIASVLR